MELPGPAFLCIRKHVRGELLQLGVPRRNLWGRRRWCPRRDWRAGRRRTESGLRAYAARSRQPEQRATDGANRLSPVRKQAIRRLLHAYFAGGGAAMYAADNAFGGRLVDRPLYANRCARRPSWT